MSKDRKEEKLVSNFKEHLKSDNQTVKPIGRFVKEKIGFVEAEYGETEDGDYAWHFSSFHKAKPFPADNVLLARIMKTYIAPAVPSSIIVDVYISPVAWEKKVISVLARGICKKWNYNQEALEKPIKTVCDHITTEINRANPRRTSL